MSRPMGWPVASCWRTLPKNSKLSLISSTYLTLTPCWRLKAFSVFLSMYSGQFAHVSPAMEALGWLTVTCFLALTWLAASPSIEHPASAEPSAVSPRAAAPERPRKRRRDMPDCSNRRRSRARSTSRSDIAPDDERVLRVPGEQDVLADAERARLAAIAVGGEHRELLAAGRGHDVQDRHAEERRDGHRATQRVAPRRDAVGRRHELDLLRPHADPHGVAGRVVHPGARHVHRAVVGLDGRHLDAALQH